MTNYEDSAKLSEINVIEYLTKHPECLSRHPDILKKCFIAAKIDKEAFAYSDPKIVDLSPALATRARDEARRLTLANKSLLHVAAENMVSWKRLHHATLGLLTSIDLIGMCHVISSEFPKIFNLQQCALIIESENNIIGASALGLKVQPQQKITYRICKLPN